MLHKLLMVPVAAGAGALSIWLAKAWNEFVGVGGAVVVGAVAAVLMHLFPEKRETPP